MQNVNVTVGQPHMDSSFLETLAAIQANASRQLLCQEIGLALNNPPYSIIFNIHLVLLLAILLSMGLLVCQYLRHKIVLHGNLLILLANIVAVSYFHILGQFAWLLRYRIILIFSSDPCDLLTPLWMVALFYGPVYVQTIGCPSLHLCVMIERVRATLLATKYENEGQKLGLWMIGIIWTLSLAFLAFVIVTAYLDSSIPSQLGIIYLSSKYSTQPLFYLNIVTMAMVILTAMCDLRLTLVNNRLRKTRLSNSTVDYSLSRNYQLNENALAMRLILPVDLIYALLFSLFNALVIWVRAERSALSLADYRLYYNMINTLLFLYTLMTTLVYIRFIHYVSKCQKRSIAVKSNALNTHDYFNHLQSQWNRAV